MNLSDINSQTFESWSLNDKVVHDDSHLLPEWSLPYLTTPKAWENYSDDLVYECDKRMRAWLRKMKGVWKNRFDRRYQSTELIKIFGLESMVHSPNDYRKVRRVFKYYSTRYQKETTVNGKRKRKVYTVSPTRLKLNPYSLRLRLEELNGEEAPWQHFKLPKDDLELGHARNPRTEKNMRLREEEGRRQHNEYKRNQRKQSNNQK